MDHFTIIPLNRTIYYALPALFFVGWACLFATHNLLYLIYYCLVVSQFQCLREKILRICFANEETLLKYKSHSLHSLKYHNT